MSTQIRDLQTLIGVKSDGVFGPQTLRAVRDHFKLTNEQVAHFIGQCNHETGGLRIFEENLNYSASGLRKTFAKYFPTDALANQYARKPEMIANRVYGNRMGNGNEASGDGWRSRGRSAIQLTGRNNYTEFAKYIGGQSILTKPDPVATKYAFHAAKFFFDRNNLWPLCNVVNTKAIEAVTRRVNGGQHGISDRIDKTNLYYNWLK